MLGSVPISPHRNSDTLLGANECLNCMSCFWQAGGSTGLLMDLAANEKAVHSDFFNGKTHVLSGLFKSLNLFRLIVIKWSVKIELGLVPCVF